MDCPKCGKPAIKEGEYKDVDLEETMLSWFCLDCRLMKRLVQNSWVKVSKEVIAIMVSTPVLEEMAARFSDEWTWDSDDEDRREWMDILNEELAKRRTNTAEENSRRFSDMKLLGVTDDRFHIYEDGKVK